MKRRCLLLIAILLCLLLCQSAFAAVELPGYSITKICDGDSFIDNRNATVDHIVEFHSSATLDEKGHVADFAVWLDDGEAIHPYIYYHTPETYLLDNGSLYLLIVYPGDNDQTCYDVYRITCAGGFCFDDEEYVCKLWYVGGFACNSNPDGIRVNIDGSLSVLERWDALWSPCCVETRVVLLDDYDYYSAIEYAQDQFGTCVDTEPFSDDPDMPDRVRGVYILPVNAQTLDWPVVVCITQPLPLYAEPDADSEIVYTLEEGCLAAALGWNGDWIYLCKYENNEYICSGWLQTDPDAWDSIFVNGESVPADYYIYGLPRGG